MNPVTDVLVIAALLGSALIGGVFFAFSSFIMKGLGRIPAAEGIAAMQSINVTVLNATFLGTFIGTAVLSALIAGLAAVSWSAAAAPWYLAGALVYFVGTFLVTGLGNVPLNNQLAVAAGPDAIIVWRHYLDRWTLLNTVRTLAALVAALTFTIGLLQRAG